MPTVSTPPATTGSRAAAAVKRSAAPGEISSPAGNDPEEVQRWTAGRRMALVLSILKGDMSAEEGARRHRLTAAEIHDWKERMLVAAHNALRSRPRDEDAMRDQQIRRLKQKVGELVLEVDVLREALHGARSAGDVEANDD